MGLFNQWLLCRETWGLGTIYKSPGTIYKSPGTIYKPFNSYMDYDSDYDLLCLHSMSTLGAMVYMKASEARREIGGKLNRLTV